MLIFSQWLSFGWQAEMVDANIFIGQQHGCCVSTRANSRKLSSFSVRIEGVTDPSPFLRPCWLRLEEGAGANYPKGSYENINNCVCLPDQHVLQPTQTFWFQEVQSEGGEALSDVSRWLGDVWIVLSLWKKGVQGWDNRCYSCGYFRTKRKLISETIQFLNNRLLPRINEYNYLGRFSALAICTYLQKAGPIPRLSCYPWCHTR